VVGSRKMGLRDVVRDLRADGDIVPERGRNHPKIPLVTPSTKLTLKSAGAVQLNQNRLS
jgi:hypothetical protein